MWGTRMFVLFALVALLTLSVAAADTTVAADGSAVDRTPVILIADPGIDDAAALLLAASSPLFELVGVVSSFGCHSDVARTSANARRVLRSSMLIIRSTAHLPQLQVLRSSELL